MEASVVSPQPGRRSLRLPRPGVGASIALGIAALVVILLLIAAPTLLAAILLVLVPMAVGVGLAMLGIGRGWAPWPWIAGLGFVLIPAAYMTFVNFCHSGSGTCPDSKTIDKYHLGVITLGLALAGFALLISTRRSLGRDIAFGVISVAAQAWMIKLLVDTHQAFAVALICAFIALGVLDAVRSYLQARRRAAEAQAELPPT